MAERNPPPSSPDKNPTGINPTDRRTNETPDGHNTGKQPEQDVDGRGPKSSDPDRGTVPNPGRDITTGGSGSDGTNRKIDSTTGSADTDSDVPTDAAEITDEEEEETKA